MTPREVRVPTRTRRGSLPAPLFPLFQLGITGSQRRQDPGGATIPGCHHPGPGGQQGERPVPSCLLQPRTSPSERREPLSHPHGASEPKARGTRGLRHPLGSPRRLGDMGTRGELAALTGHRLLLILPAWLFLGAAGSLGRAWDRGQPWGQRRPPWGWDNSPELWIWGSHWLQTRGFCSLQEFSSPSLLDEAALKGLSVGCSEELDLPISIALTPKFGDMGPEIPLHLLPPTFWGFCSDLGTATAAAQPLPGCLNGSDECFGLLWDFFSNHFFGFGFNLKCLSRLWLSWALPKADTVPSAPLGPPRAPQNLAQGWGVPPLVPSSMGGSVPNPSISSSGTGTSTRGEGVFGGCGVGWGGQGLLCRRKISWEGKALEETRRKKELSQIPTTSSVSCAGRGSSRIPDLAWSPPCPSGSWDFGWISPPRCFSSSARGIFTPWNGYLALPSGSATARSWDGLSPPSPPTPPAKL